MTSKQERPWIPVVSTGAVAIGAALDPSLLKDRATGWSRTIDLFLDYGLFTYEGTDAFRGPGGGNESSASFPVPGLGSPVGYKWSAWAMYVAGSPDISDYTTTLYDLYYFMYHTVCPWLRGPDVTAGSHLLNIVDTSGTDTGVWRLGVIIGSQGAAAIPTLGTWGLLVLGALLAGACVCSSSGAPDPRSLPDDQRARVTPGSYLVRRWDGGRSTP